MMCPLCNSNSRDELTATRLRAHVLQCRLVKATKAVASRAEAIKVYDRRLTQLEAENLQHKQELDIVRRERAEAMGRSLERGRELEEAKNDLANANRCCEQWRESFERMRDNWHQQNLRRRRLAAKKKRANRGRK